MRQQLSEVVNKAQTLIEELTEDKPQFIKRLKPSDENLQGDKSDKEFTEPFLERHIRLTYFM